MVVSMVYVALGQHKYSNDGQHITSVVNLWYLIVPLCLSPGYLRGKCRF